MAQFANCTGTPFTYSKQTSYLEVSKATATKPSTGFLPVRKCTSPFYRHETHTDRPAERVGGDWRCARLPVTPTNVRREERRHSKRGRNFDDLMLCSYLRLNQEVVELPTICHLGVNRDMSLTYLSSFPGLIVITLAYKLYEA